MDKIYFTPDPRQNPRNDNMEKRIVWGILIVATIAIFSVIISFLFS